MGTGASADAATAKSEAVKLLGPKLLKGGEEVDTETVFDGKKAVALYFSAHWCPPCRGFTPKLAEMYKNDLAGKGLEVVFISSDRDEKAFTEYFKEQPWLALPYSERDKKNDLSKRFKVEGIPSLIILNAEDASLITKDGRSAVMSDPKGDKLPWIPPTFAEALGDKFLKSGGDAVDKKAIEGKTLGLYFSAHWCPPCRSFTPELAKWYTSIKGELGDKFEIIFCSGDKDEEGMLSYFKDQCDAGGDWLCLPFGNKDSLDGIFEVSGIPAFLIVSPDGKVINKGGRSLVSSKAEASGFPWKPSAIADLEEPDGINETPAICMMLESCSADLQKKIIDAVLPIAASYAEKDEPELIFFAAKAQGNVANQIRGMTGIESAGQSFKNASSSDETPKDAPKLIRSVSTSTPTIVLMDIPDKGGYYVGRMAEALDGTGIEKMIADWKAKTLERKQLG